MIEKTELVFAHLRTAEFEATVLGRRAGDGTINRIAQEAGVMINTVRRQLENLHKQGRAHIVGWTESNPRAPIWASGPGQHAPKPAPRSLSEKMQLQREYRAVARERRTPKDREPQSPARELQKIDQFINQVRATGPQPWFAALESA
jgi:hypothetical protein